MMNEIEEWVQNVSEQSETFPHLEVVSCSKGWSAKVVDDGFLLLDSAGENFMIAEGSTMEKAISALCSMCVKDLKEMV